MIEPWRREALAAREAVILSIECPYCGAPAGSRCRSLWDHTKPTRTHGDRKSAAFVQKRAELTAAVKPILDAAHGADRSEP